VFSYFFYIPISLSQKKKYFSSVEKNQKKRKKMSLFSSKFRVYTASVYLWSNRCEKKNKKQKKKIYKVPAIVD